MKSTYSVLALVALASASPLSRRTLADTLLGKGRSLECHPHGMANSTDSFTAVHGLVTQLEGGAKTLSPGSCLDTSEFQAVASICNKGTAEQAVDYDQAQLAFDILDSDCTNKRMMGHLKTSDGLVFNQWIKGFGNERRSSAGIVARQGCQNSGDIAVTGCTTQVCDPKNSVDGGGNCPWNPDALGENTDYCSRYCEHRLAKYHGPPSRLEGIDFCQGLTCGYEKSIEYTQEVSASIGFGVENPLGSLPTVISGGVTIGIAFSTTHGTTTTWQIQDECGWFVKAPIYFETCGDMSYYEPDMDVMCSDMAEFKSTEYDKCSTGQLMREDGQPNVPLVFERADCSTQQSKPIEEQHESYVAAYGAEAATAPKGC